MTTNERTLAAAVLAMADEIYFGCDCDPMSDRYGYKCGVCITLTDNKPAIELAKEILG